jgi:hypothetical protein
VRAVSKTSQTQTADRDLKAYINDVDSDLVSIIKAFNLGFRPDQYTTTQRNALTELWQGRLIVNTTTNKLNVYLGSGWEAITSS